MKSQNRKRAKFIPALYKACGRANSYSRMDVLLSGYVECLLQPKQIPRWFSTFGAWWNCCDNIGLYRETIAEIFSRHPQYWFHMMDENDRAGLAALPEVVTLYRGCGPDNKNGLSWSLSQHVARSFPILNRYRQEKPLLIKAKVHKTRIVALKLDRREQEVIVVLESGDIEFESTIITERRSAP